MPATAVDAGVGEIDENTAEPVATVTPLLDPIDAEEESARVSEATAPLHAAGIPLTVTAVTFPAVTVQLVAVPDSDPQEETAENPAPSLVVVVVDPAANATLGRHTATKSATRTRRAPRRRRSAVVRPPGPTRALPCRGRWLPTTPVIR
jgi:hypothetical protein